MATVTDLGADRGVAALSRRISATVLELAKQSLTVDLAAKRGDVRVLADASEGMRTLSARWSELYRELLVAVASSR